MKSNKFCEVNGTEILLDLNLKGQNSPKIKNIEDKHALYSKTWKFD